MTHFRVSLALIVVLFVAIAVGVVITWLSHDVPAVVVTTDDSTHDDSLLSPTVVTPFREAIELKPAAGPTTDQPDLPDSTPTQSSDEPAEAIASAETGTASLSVRASSSLGTPLSGVSIELLQTGPAENSANLLLRLAKHSVRVSTDADGRAVVHGLAEWPTCVRCERKGFAPPEPVVVVARGQEIALVLRPTGQVSGVVVGSDGAPVERVIVGRIDGGYNQNVETAAGRFSLEVPLGDTVDLGVTGERWVANQEHGVSTSDSTRSYYRGRLRGVSAPASDLVLIVEIMPSDRSMQVVVRDADGLPAARIVVRLRLPRFDMLPVHTNLNSREIMAGRTDAEGRATFTGLPDEELWILASPGEGGGGPWVAASPGRATPNGQSIELRLRRGGTIAGIVLDPDGTPVWGDIVRVSSPQENGAAVVTDASGRFRLMVAPGARYELSVEHIADRKFNTTLSEVAADGSEVVVRLGQR